MVGELVYVIMKGVIDVFISMLLVEVVYLGIIVNVINLGLIDIGWMIEEIK